MRSLIALFSLLLPLALPAPAGALDAEFTAASDAVLSNPHDIDLSSDGKLLYVSDLGNDRVAVLDAISLALVGSFGEKDGLAAPHDVDLGPDGRLYVADTGNDRIVIYDLDGRSGSKVGVLEGRIGAPEGVLAHPNGRVYATGAGSGNIVEYRDGKVVREAGGLRAPHDVAAGEDGFLWVADAGNDRMLLMSPTLQVVRELKGKPYEFRGPRYQDVTADGLLVVADKYTHRVKIIGRNGELVAVIGSGKPRKGPGEFRTPEGVVIRGDDVWISDSGNDRIVRYRLVR